MAFFFGHVSTKLLGIPPYFFALCHNIAPLHIKVHAIPHPSSNSSEVSAEFEATFPPGEGFGCRLSHLLLSTKCIEMSRPKIAKIREEIPPGSICHHIRLSRHRQRSSISPRSFSSSVSLSFKSPTGSGISSNTGSSAPNRPSRSHQKV